jgi:hypothetical protein
MPFLVGVLVEAERLDTVGPVRHDGFCAAIIEPLPQLGAVIGGIAEQLSGRPGASDEALSRWAIVGLAAGQEDGKKTASSI